MLVAWQLGLLTVSAADSLLVYIEKGCPSPEKTWGSRDYVAVRGMLEAGQLPLLRQDDPELGPVFARMVNGANLIGLKNRGIAPQLRLGEGMQIISAAANVMKLYLNRMVQGEKAELELTLLCNFSLDVAATMLEIVDEFASSIPEDKRTEQMKLGIEQMRMGLVQMFEGALTSVEDRSMISTPNRFILISGFFVHYPRVSSFLPSTVNAEFLRKVTLLEGSEPDERVRGVLAEIRQSLARPRQNP